MSTEKNIPKYRAIAETIRREMAACKGRGVPFSKTQLELAAEFQVNRQTIRHALDWLERHHPEHPPKPDAVTLDEDDESPLPKIGFPLWVNSLENLNVAGIEFRLQMAHSISVELANLGFQLDLQCVGPQRSPKRKKIARLCKEWHGLVLEPNAGESEINSDHPFASMRDRTVVIGTLQDTHHNSVCPDFYTGAQLAMEELLRCGARKILYTGPRDEYPAHQFVRIAGAEKALERHPDAELLYMETASSAEKAFSEVKRFFMEGGKADAILASTPYAGTGAIRALADLGIRVPEEVQLVSIGQSTLGTYLVPRPTAVTQSNRMGLLVALMMEHLLRRNARPQANILVPMQLVKGETTRDIIASPSHFQKGATERAPLQKLRHR